MKRDPFASRKFNFHNRVTPKTMPNSKSIDELHELIAKQQFDKITDENWETLLASLSEKRDWEQMWQLVHVAPAMWSVRFLLRLKETTWRPEQTTEQAAFTQLVNLMEECNKEETDILRGESVHCQTALEGHSGGVGCIAISSDGQELTSWSWDGIVRLWRLPDRMVLNIMEKPTFDTTCVAIRSDGRMLACRDFHEYLSYDSIGPYGDRVFYYYVCLWRLPDGMLLHTLKGHSYDTSDITCLAFSPDGRLLASGSDDKTIRLWHLPDGRLLKTLKGHTNTVTCIAISPDEQVLVSGSRDGTVWLCSLIDRNVLRRLEWRTGWITCLEISHDGQVLASGSKDKTIRLWSLPDGTLLHTLEGHTREITCLAMSPDGRWLASGSSDNTVRLWCLPDGILLQTLKGPTCPITCLAISPDGRLLASGSKDGTIRLWALWRIRLKQLLSELTSPEHVKWVEDTLKEEKVTDAERKWLEFLLALMRWQQRRHDVRNTNDQGKELLTYFPVYRIL